MIQAIVFLPLLGALIAGLLGRVIGHRPSEYVTTGLLVASAALSWVVFGGYLLQSGGTLGAPLVDGHAGPLKVEVLAWIQSGALDLNWVLRVDTLTAVMLVVVTSVSALVHVYSIGYMADDPHRARFFSYLSLFTFAMLMLVTADNFLQMFFGWEGVGLASYLLIGFWYQRPSANAAAMKAFVVNRVGDFGFALGIFAAWAVLGHLDFDGAFHAVGVEADATMRFLSWDLHAMTVVCLLLFMGAMGKSAQFLLHTWLPDAMEGPTPVSALIHAATMVTAGVFMVARLSPLFEASDVAMLVVMAVGAITAFFAATVGLVQNDIKRVIAYSTCSQLGYMFVALGAGAYSVGIFHLFTHAFFKALLFLGAGSVIHAMHHEQDMRKMGGLAKRIPFTYWMMVIGTLALTGVGIPGSLLGFAGFFSKDAIVEVAWAKGGDAGTFAFILLVIAALFTSFYSWRLIHLTFHGKARWAHSHGAEPFSPLTLTLSPDGRGDDGAEARWNAAGYSATPHPALRADLSPEGRGEEVRVDTPVDTSSAGLPRPSGERDGVRGKEHAHAHVDHAHVDHTHAADHHAPHESPPVMLVPLGVLAVGAIFAGVVFNEVFFGHAQHVAHFFAGSLVVDAELLGAAHHVEIWVKWAPTLAMILGFAAAWQMYIRAPTMPARLAAANPGLYRFLLNKWYFDELYDRIFVRPALAIGTFLWKQVDDRLIDGTIVEGLGRRVKDVTGRMVRLQSGYLYHYAFAMLIGVALLLTWAIAAGGLNG